MRKNIITRIMAVVAVLVFFTSCYETEVSPTIDPGNYPTATFSYDAVNSVSEGDQLVIKVTLDKPLEWDVAFEWIVGEGTNLSADDYTISGGEIPAFYTEGEIVVSIASDALVEETEKLVFDVEIDHHLETKWLLNPETSYPSFDLDVVNVNEADTYTMNFGWTDADASDPNDFDMYLFYHSDGVSQIFDAAATGDNPEVFMEAANADDFPDGTYYVGIDVWHAGASESVVPILFGLGNPDQSVEFLTGEFDLNNMDKYAVDSFPAWGVGAKRIFEIQKSGGNLTTKFLAQ